jgi:hypothetical protein
MKYFLVLIIANMATARKVLDFIKCNVACVVHKIDHIIEVALLSSDTLHCA